MDKKILIIVGLVLTLFTILGHNRYLDLGFIDALERHAYDLRVRLSSSSERDSRVVIIDVDEPSLLAHGQFPWPRSLLADIVNKLFDVYQIDTLGFDVLFAEPENSFSLQQIEESLRDGNLSLSDLELQAGDARLAKAIENRSVVLGIAFESARSGGRVADSVGVLPQPAFSHDQDYHAKLTSETGAPIAQRYSANIPLLQNATNYGGFLSILVQDPDGSIRRVGILNEYQGKLYSSLSLQIVQAFFMDQPEAILVDDPDDQYNGLEGIRMLHADIPLDADAGIYVPYSTPGKAYEFVSATEILNETYSGDISGAIALFGTTSVGLVDRRNTPVMPGMPGVEVHANLVSALLDGDFRTKPGWVLAVDFLVLLIAGLLMSIALPYLTATSGTLFFALCTATITGINWFYWSEELLILSIAPVLLLTTVIYLVNMVVGFFVESQARLSTQKNFGLYVPPEVVSQISSQKDMSILEAERREMTVLFADIREFTAMAENMPPVELSDWLNDFLTPMTRIIHKHGGAIDKYMGDAIMAFWGAPIADPAHAEKAISAALEMLDHVQELNQQFSSRGQPTVNIGLGINTGLMAVGNMGSEFRMAYTVVGDAVNLGSRLEQLTKVYDVPLVVSEFTASQASNYEYERLDHVKVKGKQTAVTIFTVSGQSKKDA